MRCCGQGSGYEPVRTVPPAGARSYPHDLYLPAHPATPLPTLSFCYLHLSIQSSVIYQPSIKYPPIHPSAHLLTDLPAYLGLTVHGCKTQCGTR